MIEYFPLIVPSDLICEESPILKYSTLAKHVCNVEIHPQEKELVTDALPKRQNEFITGRICVRRALRKLQIYNYPVLFNKYKLPVFPSTISGSITHTSNYCAAILGVCEKYHSIGIDIEEVINMKHEYFETICTEEELLFLKKFSGIEQLEKATVFFSAKEAFYKLQFQLTHKLLNFKDVCCSILNGNTFSIKLRKHLCNRFFYNATFLGSYHLSNGMVFSALYLENG